jgi:hypothetical protein
MSDYFFPFTGLLAGYREVGMLVALLIGVAFGFTLERAGFGQATKLAAQFYLTDMRVFKVMFSAIVTAMVGVMVFSGVGLVDLTAISQSAVSWTYIWPMLVGGLLLGMGFIISGYCPGTSLVASASGNLDGVVAFGGAVIGSLVFGEVYAASEAVRAFHVSGNREHLFLYDLLGLPAPVLALLVTFMALGMFLGAERVERWANRRKGGERELDPAERRPRRLAFGSMGLVAVLGLLTLALPDRPRAAQPRRVVGISQEALAHRLLDEPWTLRIIDLRGGKACADKTLPGAQCVAPRELARLGLPYTAGERDLVLVGAGELKTAPAEALAYPGKVYKLRGGFAGWKRFALTRPTPPAAGASERARQSYAFRAALHSAMTGVKPAPPVPKGGSGYTPKKRKKKGGGCG